MAPIKTYLYIGLPVVNDYHYLDGLNRRLQYMLNIMELDVNEDQLLLAVSFLK